jgi:hypothetical protein
MENRTKIVLGLAAAGVVAYLVFRPKKSASQTNFSGDAVPKILKDWKDNFDNKRLEEITNNYTPDGILVSTFGDILYGRNEIKDYFAGLFEKDNLSVDYLGNPDIKDLKDVKVYTGLYQFNYSENGVINTIKARYSFISQDIDGKTYIFKQHSSIAN